MDHLVQVLVDHNRVQVLRVQHIGIARDLEWMRRSGVVGKRGNYSDHVLMNRHKGISVLCQAKPDGCPQDQKWKIEEGHTKFLCSIHTLFDYVIETYYVNQNLCH